MIAWYKKGLVYIMACCISSKKPLSKPVLVYDRLETIEQYLAFIQNYIIFIQEIAVEIVICDVSTTLIWGAIS